jgi:alpha-galactosidase
LIEKYCTHGTGWNPGEYAYILKEYQRDEATWKDQAREWFAAETPIDIERGHEYAAYIINALMGGEMFTFNGNVPNTNLVTNLPYGACVEVPVLVDKGGFHPIYVGALPAECAILTNLNSQIEEMAISASQAGDTVMIYRAICHDPLTAAVLSLRETKDMVNEMFAQNAEYLPQFNHYKV